MQQLEERKISDAMVIEKESKKGAVAAKTASIVNNTLGGGVGEGLGGGLPLFWI